MNCCGALETCPTGLLDLTREACSLVGWRPGQRVIDIGCGEGSTVSYLRRECGVSAFGVDLWLPRGEALFQGCAECLPVASGSLDGILAECSLSAMADRDKVIAECARVLAPGGSLVIADLYARNGDSIADGVLVCKELLERIVAHGFQIRLWEDHSEVLKQLVFRVIMEHNCDSMEQICQWKSVRAGYFLLIAKLPKRNGYGR
jgi:ubiquinone/menaquinone biosynthesis C-methylase UbiE